MTLPSNTDRDQHLCMLLKPGFKILAATDQYHHEPDPAGGNARGDAAVRARAGFCLVQSPGGYKFWVGTTHQKSKNPGIDADGERGDNSPEVMAQRVEDTKWRNREARTHEIMKELEKAGPSDVILLGDMNDDLGMDEVEAAGRRRRDRQPGRPAGGRVRPRDAAAGRREEDLLRQLLTTRVTASSSTTSSSRSR